MNASELLRLIGCMDETPTSFVRTGPPSTKRTDGSAAAELRRASRLWAEAFGERVFKRGVAVAIVFYRHNCQRIDIDNMTKFIMDAGTIAGVWRDDCQVIAMASRIEFDRDNPRTEVAVGEIVTTMDRSDIREATCEICKVAFSRNPRVHLISWRFCSIQCSQAKGLRDARCPTCNVVFRRTKAAQRYCSPQCKRTNGEAIRIGKMKPPKLCSSCSKPVSKRQYIQCSDCAPKGRRRGSKNRPRPSPLCAAQGALL